MLRLETSRFLDEAMTNAVREAHVLGWTEEGKICFVRVRMDDAYVKARRMEKEAANDTDRTAQLVHA